MTGTSEDGLSLQEQYFPELMCFGCGPANPRGLQLRSFRGPDGRVVAHFQPWPEHDNGTGFLNGGIIATVLDCHSAAAMTVAARTAGWEPLPGALLSHLTAGIDVRYRRPAPLHDTVELIAEIDKATEPEITVAVRLEWEGKTRAEARATWKRWRPR